MVTKFDSVSDALMALDDDDARAEAISWVTAETGRHQARRRTNLCSMAAVALILAGAIASAAISMSFATKLKVISEELPSAGTGLFASIYTVPIGLSIVAGLIVVATFVCWLTGKLPGHAGVLSAIDWSTCSDAMSRLLKCGKTYPDACRVAGSVAQTRSGRLWFAAAAARVERGEPMIRDTHGHAGADASVVEAMIESAKNEPHLQWHTAAQHFGHVLEHRLALMVTVMPMMATLLTGLLVWLAISSTLGYMWRAISQMIGGLT